MSKTTPTPLNSPDGSTLPAVDRPLRRQAPRLLYVLLPVLFALGLGVGYLLWGGQNPTEVVAQAVSATQTAIVKAEEMKNFRRYDVPIDDDPVIGPDDAPITIIEFSDFQCPFCEQWHAQVYTQLRQNYAKQVRIVYRDFPLTSIHPEATPAAEAANCANEQEAFWPFHDKLLGGSLDLSAAAYQQYATELGLDMTRFNECLASHRYADEVQADFDFAANLGVQSTPTFFINGIPLVGAQPYSVFKQVIDKELAGEFPK